MTGHVKKDWSEQKAIFGMYIFLSQKLENVIMTKNDTTVLRFMLHVICTASPPYIIYEEGLIGTKGLNLTLKVLNF